MVERSISESIEHILVRNRGNNPLHEDLIKVTKSITDSVVNRTDLYSKLKDELKVKYESNEEARSEIKELVALILGMLTVCIEELTPKLMTTQTAVN